MAAVPAPETLATRALAVLAKNRRGAWTRPASTLYPHLWSWDSAFVAIGLAPHDAERGLAELEACMAAQWEDGMVPHVRYAPDPDGAYFPQAEYWRPPEDLAPPGIATSGITQPPVHAMAARRLHDAGVAVSPELFHRLVRWHRYLLGPRDPEASGGVTILHPWESGTDNSPRWDGPLLGYALTRRPEYRRVDQGQVQDAGERPRDEDYDRYLDLVLRLREHGYRPERLPDDYPFRVKDVLITSVLAAANRDLIALAEALGHRRERELLADLQERILRGFRRLFRVEVPGRLGHWYVDRDMRTGAPLGGLSCAGACAVLVGLDEAELPEPEAWLAGALDGPFAASGRSHRLLPSVAPGEPGFDPVRYWRGPVWINIQWLLARGLGPASPLAGALRAEGLRLVEAAGFREYYHPETGAGLGAEDFSWTAALALDWMDA